MQDTAKANTLGETLHRLRDDAGLTRAALAHASQTSEATIVRAELYNSAPRLTTLQAWADALGVSVGVLLGEAT